MMKQGRAGCPTFTGAKLLALGIDYGTALSSKTITSTVEAMTDSTDLVCSVISLVGTSVS